MHTMHRRTFLAGASASLLGLGLSLRSSTTASAQDAPYAGPFWIFVHASGGWDPTFLFNPTDRAEHNRLYTQIGKVGNIPYAGWEIDADAMGLDPNADYTGILYSPRTFLQKLGARMTVINGVDTTTNNHDSGTRAMASGKLTEGYPALAAMVAKAGGPRMPLAFLAGGGYDATMGLVPAVRLSNVDTLSRLGTPNIINPNDRNSETYHTANTWARIRAAQRERLARMQRTQKLPNVEKALAGLVGARLADGNLAKLALPERLDLGLGGLGGLENAMRQAQLAVAAFKGGLAVSAGISVGGFDTHGDHDRNQPRQLAELLGAVAFALDELARAGLDKKTYVVVTSDFGRGPSYNGTGNGSGKDHWPITSLLAFGPKVKGNRVVGSTDDDQRSVPVDPVTLKPAKDGVVIDPAHVHVALRALAGIDDGPLASEYPIAGDALPLFG